jgi:hypothetical protein
MEKYKQNRAEDVKWKERRKEGKKDEMKTGKKGQ